MLQFALEQLYWEARYLTEKGSLDDLVEREFDPLEAAVVSAAIHAVERDADA